MAGIYLGQEYLEAYEAQLRRDALMRELNNARAELIRSQPEPDFDNMKIVGESNGKGGNK